MQRIVLVERSTRGSHAPGDELDLTGTRRLEVHGRNGRGGVTIVPSCGQLGQRHRIAPLGDT